jgi:hypothetical protein
VENILINFTADPSGLQPGIEGLIQLGAVDKEVADQAKKTMDAYSKRDKAISDGAQGSAQSMDKLVNNARQLDKIIVGGAYDKALKALQKEVDATGDEFKQLATVIEFAKKKMEGLKPNSAEWDELNKQVAAGEQLLKAFGEQGGITEKKAVSLRTELKNLKQEIASKLEGGASQAEVQGLLDRAGELDDRLKDINQTVSNIGSDTRNLDGLISITTAGVGIFSSFQGVLGLTGDESEDMQKALVKLNAAMSLLNGLTAVQNALLPTSAGYQLAVNIQKKAAVLATNLESAAESRNIIVRWGAVAAQKALNAVMAASPTGLLLGAIAAIAGAFYFLSSKTEETKNNLEDVNTEFERTVKHIEDLNAAIENANTINKLHIDIEGGSDIDKLVQDVISLQTEMANVKPALDAAFKALIDSNVNFESDATEINKKARDDNQKHYDDLFKQYEGFERKRDETSLQIDLARKKKRDSDAKEAEDAAKRQAEKNKALLERDLKAQIEIVKNAKEKEIAFLNAQAGLEGSSESIRVKALKDALVVEQELIIDKRDLELKSEKLTAHERILINQTADDAIVQKRVEYGSKIIQVHQDIATELRRIEKETNDIAESEIDRQIKGMDRALTIQKRNITAGLDAEENSNIDKYKNGEISKEQYEKNKLNIQDSYNRQAIQSDIQYFEGLKTIGGLSAEKLEAADQALYDAKRRLREADLKDAEVAAQKEQELRQLATQATFTILQSISDAYFSNQDQQRQADLNRQVQALQKRKDAELNNKDLTEAQKAQIDKRYALQEAQLKTEAAKKDKESKRQQALMNGFLAVTNALATVQPFVPNALIAAGVAAATAAIQVASINSTQIPQFAKGTKSAPSGYKWVGEKGPELIYDGGGYAIIPHDKSNKLAASNFFDPEIMRSYNIPVPKPLQSLEMPQFSQEQRDLIENHYHTTTTAPAIDYNLLTDMLASKLGAEIKDIPQTKISLDENGFRKAIIQGAGETVYLNKKLEL